MGRRTLTDWVATGVNSEYRKVIPDLEARIREIAEGGTPYSLGSGIGALNNGEYYFDNSTKTLYIRTLDGGSPILRSIILYIYYQAFGTWGSQAEMDNLEIFQKFTAEVDFYIRYIRIFIIKKGNPVFTNLRIDIHPELDGYPTEKILATPENNWDNTVNNQNTLSEIWFRYDNYGIKNLDSYCLVLKASGTFDSDNHISWAKLDSVYPDGIANTTEKIIKGSNRFVIIGVAP